MTWLRQPLTVFILLGVALFAVDRFWNGAPQAIGDDNRIVVTASQQQTLRDAFREQIGREPTPQEMQTRLDQWINEEVLYREALALNLDRKDPIVHRQLTQKMRFLLDEASSLPTPGDAELQDWLDRHMERYGVPSSISFDQVFLSRGQRGDHLQRDASRIYEQLRAEPDAFTGLGDPFPLGQHIDSVNPVQLRRDFGATFAAAVESLPKSLWSRPVTSGFGLHLVRVTASRDFQPVTLAQVRSQVLSDYEVAQHERLMQAAIEALKKKYRIVLEGRPG